MQILPRVWTWSSSSYRTFIFSLFRHSFDRSLFVFQPVRQACVEVAPVLISGRGTAMHMQSLAYTENGGELHSKEEGRHFALTRWGGGEYRP